jgi:serine/threonine protein phosphatase PrpC
MRLWAWGQSDPGKKRERNEDSYLVDPQTGIMAVADGMGGHQGGATASRMAVEQIGRELAAAAGDFEKALRDQISGAMGRTTEEMPVIDPMVTPPSGPNLRTSGLDASFSSPVNGDDPTFPGNQVISFSPALEVMRGVVKRASTAIYEAAWAKPELRGMGTTLTAVLVHGGRAHVIHAGDSRCYMFRDGQLRQLTDDHSWIAEQLRSGAISEAEAKSSKFAASSAT